MGKHQWLELSKRMRSMIEDHTEKREENTGKNLENYTSVEGQKRNENP